MLPVCPAKAGHWVRVSSLKSNQVCANNCIPLIKAPKWILCFPKSTSKINRTPTCLAFPPRWMVSALAEMIKTELILDSFFLPYPSNSASHKVKRIMHGVTESLHSSLFQVKAMAFKSPANFPLPGLQRSRSPIYPLKLSSPHSLLQSLPNLSRYRPLVPTEAG